MAVTNRISIVQGKDVVVSADGNSITLTSGKPVLKVGATNQQGQALTNRNIEVRFQHENGKLADEPGAPTILPEKAGDPEESDTLRPLDKDGFAAFHLHLPVKLKQDIYLYVKLRDEPQEERGTNLFVMQVKLNSSTNPDEDKVTDLKIVSGDKQGILISGGDDFVPLVVQALSNNVPVPGVVVKFGAAEPVEGFGATGCEITPVNDGVTSSPEAHAAAGVRRGTRPGVFTVTATCNNHSVTFHLALLPEVARLKLVSLPVDTWPDVPAVNPKPCIARLVTASNPGQAWPYATVVIQQPMLSGPVEIQPMTFPYKGNLSEKGELPPVGVHFKRNAPSDSSGTLSYSVTVAGSAEKLKASFPLSISH